MLVTKSVSIKIINFNIDMYKAKGYNCKIGDILDVNVEDVSHFSKSKVIVKCDKCNLKTKETTVESLYNTKEYKDGSYICPECYKEEKQNRICEVCGDNTEVTFYKNKQWLCRKHQNQQRNGGIRRTVKDGNDIRIFDNYAEFDTYDKYGNVNGIYKIDKEFIDFIKTHKIHKHKDGYACYKFKDENNKTKNMRLHRYIMNVHQENDNIHVVDHINQDKSDNRKINLRLATYLDNTVNTKMLSTNTSGHKGISFDKRCEQYEAYIHQNNKKISLGRYSDYNRAVYVREIAEIIYFGEKNPKYNELIKRYIDDPQIQQLLINNRKKVD